MSFRDDVKIGGHPSPSQVGQWFHEVETDIFAALNIVERHRVKFSGVELQGQRELSNGIIEESRDNTVAWMTHYEVTVGDAQLHTSMRLDANGCVEFEHCFWGPGTTFAAFIDSARRSLMRRAQESRLR